MVVISTGSSFSVLFMYLSYLGRRQLSARGFILGSVLPSPSLVFLRSKSCAGLFMSTADRNPMEKAALLECFNEKI